LGAARFPDDQTDAEGRYRLRTVRGMAEDGTTSGEYAIVIHMKSGE
jgi:hypothetical protein